MHHANLHSFLCSDKVLFTGSPARLPLPHLLHNYRDGVPFLFRSDTVGKPFDHTSLERSLYRQTSLNSVRQKGLLAVSNLDMNH